MKIIGLILISIILINTELISQDLLEKSEVHCDSTLKSMIQTEVVYYLAERMVKFLPTPNNPNCETGLFSINIMVNQKGDVIESKIDKKKSSDLSEKLETEIIKTANDSKFQPDKNAIKKQRGNITYLIKKKE